MEQIKYSFSDYLMKKTSPSEVLAGSIPEKENGVTEKYAMIEL